MRRLTPSDALAMTKDVQVGTAPDGEPLTWTIRKLAADEMIALGWIPASIVLNKRSTEEDIAASAFGPDLAERTDRIMASAVVGPRLFAGPLEHCPPDAVWCGYLGAVRDGLVKEIYAFSKVAEDAEKAARFRDGGDVGGDAARALEAGGVPADGPPGDEAARAVAT